MIFKIDDVRVRLLFFVPPLYMESTIEYCPRKLSVGISRNPKADKMPRFRKLRRQMRGCERLMYSVPSIYKTGQASSEKGRQDSILRYDGSESFEMPTETISQMVTSISNSPKHIFRKNPTRKDVDS